jgi:hypothetical protein
MDIGHTARRWVVLNKDKQPGGVLVKVDAGHEDLGERANVLGRGEGALRKRDTEEKSMSGQSSSSIEADRNEEWGMEGVLAEVEVTEEDKVRASPGLLLGRCVSEDFPSPDEEEDESGDDDGEEDEEGHAGGRKKQVVRQGKGARNRNMYDGCIVKYSPSSKLYTIYFVDEGCAEGVDSEQYKFSIEATLKILLPRSAGQTARVRAKIEKFMKKHKPKQTVATPPGNGATGKASSGKKSSSHVSRSKTGWGASGGGRVPRAIQQAVHQAGMTQAELGRELGLRQAAELAGLEHWLVRR